MKPYMNVALWLLFGLLAGTMFFFLLSSPQPPSQPAPPANNSTIITPPLPPAPPQAKKEVNLTMIEAPSCDQCNLVTKFLLEQTTAQIANSSEVTVGRSGSISALSAEAKSLISRYNLAYLPAIIISSSEGMSSEAIDAWRSEVGSIEPDGALVQRKIYPPYFVLANNTTVGFVGGIAIQAADCPKCLNASMFLDSLEQSSLVSMAFYNKTVLDEESPAAQALITKYNVTELPALFLTLDAAAYPVYTQLKPLGSERDGWFILRKVQPPYVQLAPNRSIRGLVDSIQIVNSSCSDCFVVNDLSDYIVNAVGIELENKTVVEAGSAEGKALIGRYRIKSIPALLYSPETSVYPKFDDTWKNQNNTIEPDGWYVFRAYGFIKGNYQNISG
ncbi:MAG: hypothetical protein U0R44_04840 [Candidatus Micrarchaeia archaeon]